MRRYPTIVLISILLLQMSTGFLANPDESDCTNMKTSDVCNEQEYSCRAGREEVQYNHSDAPGPVRSAAPVSIPAEGAAKRASSADVPVEQDEFGESWFDDFEESIMEL